MEVCTPSLSIVMDWDPANGHSLITQFPLFCNDFQNQKLLNSCSCKAAVFKAEDSSFLVGDCQLVTQNFSLITSPIRSRGYNYIAYIKVHDVQDFKPPSDDDRKSHLIIVAGTVGAAAFLVLLALCVMQRKGWLGGKVSEDQEPRGIEELQCCHQQLQ